MRRRTAILFFSAQKSIYSISNTRKYLNLKIANPSIPYYAIYSLYMKECATVHCFSCDTGRTTTHINLDFGICAPLFLNMSSNFCSSKKFLLPSCFICFVLVFFNIHMKPKISFIRIIYVHFS